MKVGKAIYNILSQSTDVQSNFPFNTTDYSPTGTELVTNGDFSAAGSNLVTNPNFTDTGSELVTNGDFATDSDWAKGTGITISGGSANFTGSPNANINQNVGLVTGKSYKIVFTISNYVSGEIDYNVGGNTRQGDIADNGTYTAYVVSDSGNFLYFQSDQTVGFVGSIDNVSVKELGEDWTANEAGTDTVTFANDQVQIVSDGVSGATGILQSGILTIGKSYKVTIDVASNTNKFKIILGGGSIEVTGTGVQTFYGEATAPPFYLYRIYGQAVDAVINSVSVQELGEGWTTGATTSIGEDKATFTASGIAQALIQTNLWTADSFSGKTIKLTYTILANDLNVTLFRIGQYSSASAFSITDLNSSVGTHTIYVNVRSSAGTDNAIDFYIQSSATTGSLSITNITVQEMILNKIFPELAPPDIDAPYVVYSVVSNSPSDTKNANGDIDTASIEVYGFQDTYNKAVDLGVSVRAALDRKTGTYNTIEIQSTNYVNEQMDVNEARKLWAAIQDYSIRIKNL